MARVNRLPFWLEMISAKLPFARQTAAQSDQASTMTDKENPKAIEGRHEGFVMFSRDEGQTWSQPVDTPWGLTGDRHHGIHLPHGRLVIVFRNASPNPKDRGFIAWVGTCDDIKQGKRGEYRVSLLKTWKDGFYPGLHLLPDGAIVATTYANYRQEDVGCSIVSVRFKMEETDTLANGSK